MIVQFVVRRRFRSVLRRSPGMFSRYSPRRSPLRGLVRFLLFYTVSYFALSEEQDGGDDWPLEETGSRSRSISWGFWALVDRRTVNFCLQGRMRRRSSFSHRRTVVSSVGTGSRQWCFSWELIPVQEKVRRERIGDGGRLFYSVKDELYKYYDRRVRLAIKI